MSITPGTSGERDAASARLTPPPPGVIGDDALRGFLGGNLIGSAGSGLDDVHGVEPGDGSLIDHGMPIGSALADVHGRHPVVQGEDLPGGADMGLEGDRDTPATRSSRADSDTLQRRDERE